jgi:hypothetical protein
VVEGARLESVYTPKGYRGFESRSLCKVKKGTAMFPFCFIFIPLDVRLMTIQSHEINSQRFAEIISDDMIVKDTASALDLMGTLYYDGYDGIVLYEKNITPEFFDLSSGLAGEVLQKFSNYKMRLAIMGQFDQYESKSLNDFIRESNAGGNTVFVSSLGELEGIIKK